MFDVSVVKDNFAGRDSEGREEMGDYTSRYCQRDIKRFGLQCVDFSSEWNFVGHVQAPGGRLRA